MAVVGVVQLVQLVKMDDAQAQVLVGDVQDCKPRPAENWSSTVEAINLKVQETTRSTRLPIRETEWVGDGEVAAAI
jgi:hypothetical protein